jgi:flagellar protein FliS
MVNRYKAVQVKTSSPGQILVLLYDGVFRFLGEAKTAIAAGDRAKAGEKIDRAHAILGELVASLSPQHAPELCDNLHGLYCFCMGQVVEANVRQEVAPIDTVIRVLTPLRDAFRTAAATVDAK